MELKLLFIFYISQYTKIHSSTESTLMKTLTKINRMDIVHLIETKITLSSQKQSLLTYAEIEQTISLDQSEGMDDNN